MNVEQAIVPGTRAESFNGGPINVQYALNFVAILNVTATGGSPTLDVKFQESLDGVTWIDIPTAAFAQATGTGVKRLEFSSRAIFVRAVCTIGGSTPSLTFSVLLHGKL